MKTILLSTMTLFLACCTASAQTEVKTVEHVDLQRYMGRWYEIASYPQWFERGMTNVSALYTLKGDRVEVVNSGLKKGRTKEAHGRAKVVPDSGNARLKVQFFWPIWGDYWIVGLAPDYSWVLVSNSTRSTLWILSRNKHMSPELYTTLCQKLTAMEFDTSKLVRMKQE